jgi:thiol-disulfide isomerase/thioredoxin
VAEANALQEKERLAIEEKNRKELAVAAEKAKALQEKLAIEEKDKKEALEIAEAKAKALQEKLALEEKNRKQAVAEAKILQEKLALEEKNKKELAAQQKNDAKETDEHIKAKKAQFTADSLKAVEALAVAEQNNAAKMKDEKALNDKIANETKELNELRLKAAAEKQALEEILKKQKAAAAALAIQEEKRKEAQKQAELQAAKIAADKIAADKAAKLAADKIAADKVAADKLAAEKLEIERAKLVAEKLELERARLAAKKVEAAQPTPAIQAAPSVAATAPVDAVQFAATKAGVEIDNSVAAVLLDPNAYKPGTPVRFDGMLINEGVPPFSFVDINGKEVRQPDLLGKVVYIDFWATWCAPCKEHIRYIQSTIEETKEKDIVYLFISVDKDPAKWRNYVRENNLGGIHVNDQQGLVSMYWNIQALPNYFLLGKDGRVAINSFIKSKKTLEDMIKYLLATNYQISGTGAGSQK